MAATGIRDAPVMLSKIKIDKTKAPDFTFTQGQDDYAVTFMGYPHNAMRVELKEMWSTIQRIKNCIQEEQVEGVKPFVLDKRDLDMFFDWWAFFAEYLKEHHDMEEEIVFPWIRSRAQFDQEVPNEHKDLLVYFGNVSALQQQLDVISNNELGLKLVQACEDFIPFLLAHFVEEEKQLTPLLRENFSEAEVNDCLHKIFVRQKKNKKVGDDGLALLLRWMTDSQRKDWERIHLTLPTRFLYERVLKKRFKKNHVKQLEDIIEHMQLAEHEHEKELKAAKDLLKKYLAEDAIRKEQDDKEDADVQAQAA